MQTPEGAFLAIADISGYTSYLAGVELDHAQDILSDLTVTVVEAMPPFVLAKLEGDAAFMYLPDHALDGSTLQDTIEGTYVAFRRRLRDIKQTSSCECNACILIPNLDLKIVVHQGTVGRQQLLGLDELVGQDVILIHRLLKNGVVERAGIDAYALYTQAAADAAEFDPGRQGLVAHDEETDVAGTVNCWLTDLHAVWASTEAQPHQSIPPERRFKTYEFEFDAPPQLIFETLTAPAMRLLWDQSIDLIEENADSSAGRRGVGTVNHCMHGADAIVERILDWHPPNSWMSETTIPMPGSPRFLKTEEFTARADGGTLATLTIGSVEGRTPSDDAGVLAMIDSNVSASVARITERITATMTDLVTEAEAMPKPPSRGERHLTEPVADTAR